MKRTPVLLMMTLVAGAVRADDPRPQSLRDVGIDQRLNQQVPLDAGFQDEADETVRLGDYFDGKPVVLVLAYYGCPMLCTEVLNGMVESLRAVPFDAGDAYQVVIVSFDARDARNWPRRRRRVTSRATAGPNAATAGIS